MKSNKEMLFLLMMTLSLAFTACEEDVETVSINDKTAKVRPQGPDDIKQPGGLPYPEIIENVYISDIELFAHTLCYAYRIEWPAYANDVDTDQIPSLFSANGGSLNSLNYMKSIDPENKAKLDLSLYYNNMLKTPYYVDGLWSLNEDYTAEVTRFVKHDISLEHLEDWVTQRPSQFEYHFTHNDEAKSEEIAYQEGDVFLMWLTDDNLYGGVRIVSTSPQKIIEVYITKPNI